MKLRTSLVAALATLLVVPTLALVAATGPTAAAPPAPVVLNGGAQNGSAAQWAETQGLPDDGGVRTFFATFLVQHAPGRTITNVRVDRDFNGNDDTGNSANNVAVTGQTYVSTDGGIETSRVTVGVNVGKPGGFGCPLFGTRVRRVDAPIKARVVDSTGEVSGTLLTTTVRFIEDSNCLGTGDFPRLTSAGQNTTEVTPGQNITYSFACDDVDTDAFSSDDNCERANLRWRRLDDGSVGGTTLKIEMNDNATQTHVQSFPSQGYYVMEAQLGNEGGGFPETGAPTGGWVRLGNAVVNDAASSLASSIAFSGANASTPPSVNAAPATTIDAVATASDSGGAIQVLEWDADGNSVFERLEYTVPTNTGGDVTHGALTTTERTQSLSVATPGLRTVRTRVTDSGALDAADNIRRQLTTTATLRVNAVPTAADVPVTTTEDNATTVHLSGADADNQPEALRYLLLSTPPASQGTVGPVSGSTVTFTPAPNFFGTATFTYQVDDGSPSTIDAHALSNVATVTVTVTSVNDIPLVDPAAATTSEDTPVDVTISGDDVEDGSALDYTVDSQPTNGSASCTLAGVCTYTPALNFNGADTYVVRGTDVDGGSATATVTVTVTAVNDAPIANDDTVVVPEDAVSFPITLSATDVDSLVLTFSGPDDDVDHGSLTCVGQACSYTPDPNHFGPDAFTFTVGDGSLTDSGTITIDVSEVNDAPVATDVPDAVTDEDVPLSLTLGGTDIDPGDTVTVASATNGSNGTTVVLPPNDVAYAPALNFHGIDTYDFTVTDGRGGFDDGTVSVTVNPVNDAPVVADQTLSISEDTPTILSIVGGDVDGDLLDWSILAYPAAGQLFGSGPDVAYVPDLDANGTDTFVVQVSDGVLVDTAIITVTVVAVNDQPVADAALLATDEDQALALVLGGSDPDGDTLTYTAPLVGPNHGTLSCTADDCTYTPAPDFNGADQFQFAVSDGSLGDSASVTVVVAPVNDPPVAASLSLATSEDTSVAVPLVGTDPDADALAYSLTAPADGTLSGTAPDLVYTPNPNWSGTETLGFTVDDGHGGSDSDLITIVVDPVNDAPVATGGTAVTAEDTTVTFNLGGTDVDDVSLTFTVDDAPAVGVLTCAPDGSCTYVPEADHSGEVVAYYSVSDGSLTSFGVFTILVDPANDPPSANNGAATTAEDTPVSVALVASDTEGDDLTYTVVSPPAHGSAVCAGSACVYTPAPNYGGIDSFTWAANDGDSSSNNAVSTITVTPVNDAPQALDVAVALNEDTPTAIQLLASDVDGDPVAYTVDDGPVHGTVTIAGSVATYTPALNYVGLDSFTYRATDPHGAFTTARVTLIVDEVPLIATSLVGEAAVARLQLSLFGPNPNGAITVFPSLRATLRKAGGAPLAGRPIRFSVGSTLLCTAVTNAQGVGTCATSAQSGLSALLNLGYQVTYEGDLDHSGTSARGPILQVLTLVV